MAGSIQPAVSIVIPAYNKEEFISACLDSAIHQTLANIEIIVVDDGSMDNTRNIISEYARNDSRIINLSHRSNRGLHATRLTGVAQASGLYTMFLDADDTLALTACESLHNFAKARPDADIIRYGLQVEIANTEETALRIAVEDLFNATVGDCNHSQILQASFSPPRGLWVPWNVATSLFRTPLIQQAFADLSDARLNKIEDGYEYLAICALSRKLYSFVEYRGLRYHFGRGISSRTTTSLDIFNKDQHSAWEANQAVQDFARKNNSEDIITASQNFQARSLKIVGDDFVERLQTENYLEGLHILQKTWGNENAYRALHEHINNHLYAELIEDAFPLTEKYALWSSLFSHATTGVQLNLNDTEQAIHESTQHILEQICSTTAERERLAYEESLRIFKTGTKARYYFDKFIPLGTHRRSIARRLAKLLLRR
ncbi:glycosyltransferase family 2 protein [Alloscardovia sp. HMSC034E08]|uniref:glycosyltransferase family 2 protein n=1 Tax=Alloscardovia sp. HMSC034E08 TaxID=1739413 RepID=UPI0008CC6951|nr:glycosyltransferase family 2 protein [Alloscardovia sp. HMSC034E08]OFQ97733.1 hypothetical protein HMPREF2909_02670 [Alloscardovia sp. HMSC034E08]